MSFFSNRVAYARDALVSRKLVFFLACGAYLLANGIVILYIYGSFLKYFRTLSALYTIPYTILTVIGAMLFGLAVVLVIEQVHQLRLKGAGLSLAAIFAGSLAAGCPGCAFGLFPIVLSFFGISGTLAILPFYGIELQVLSLVLLFLSCYVLAKEPAAVCKVRRRLSRNS